MSAVAEQASLDRWLARVRQIGAHRPHHADFAAYERFKAELARDFPGIAPADYDRAIAVFVRATGV